MADIAVTTFTNKTYKNGASTVVPGFVEGSPGSPVNPPGSGGASEFVPYVGANQNVNLGELGISTGFITLDTTPTNTPTTQGTFYWDEDDNTVDIILNGYIMKVGEDLFYPVKNQTGSSIPKGTNVRFAGTVGNSGRLLITPYLADGTYATSRYMGVTAETIGNGEDGKVLWFGRIRKINTNAYNEGDILYASTTSAGGFQTTLPVAPNNIVEVCAVVTKSVNNGVIFVRPQFLSSASKWTDVGSDIYRNSKVTIGQTSIITADLGVKQNTINSALRIDGLPLAVRRTIYNVFESTTERYKLDNYGIPQWFCYDPSTPSSLALAFTIPQPNQIGILTATDWTYATNTRGYIAWNPANTNGAVDSFVIAVRNSTSLRISASGRMSYGVGGGYGTGVSHSFGLITGDTAVMGVYGNLNIYDSSGTNTITFTGLGDLSIPSTNGIKIGTATSQKIGFWNATPIVQPTTAIAESAFVENAGGTAVNDDSTFDGYTLRQVVKALRNAGLLA